MFSPEIHRPLEALLACLDAEECYDAGRYKKGVVPHLLVKRHDLEAERGRALTRDEIENLRSWFHDSRRDPLAPVFVVIADREFCERHTLPTYIWDYPVYVVDAASFRAIAT